MNYDLLSIGAHPDDVEVGTGGVLVKHARQGRRVGIIYLTLGEMGTGGDIEVRRKEAEDAARMMGADLLVTYDWGDTSLTDTYVRRLALASDIRKYRPQIVLCPYPQVGHGRRQSHADHVACGQLTINAALLAGLRKVKVEGEPFQVGRIFHYFLPPGVMPDFVVDISDSYETWIDALKCHKSQFLNPHKSRNYLWHLESLARQFGFLAGVKYAQGFCADQTIVIENLFDLAGVPRF
jgi:bacillithiol biosynthesis deacetylase BshB1